MGNEITTVSLRWHKTKLSELHLHDETYFYAFSRANNVVYIGKSEWTTLKAEINQNLKRLDISHIGLSLWIGYVVTDKTSIKRITTQIIDDVESLLIYKIPSQHNIKKTKSYRGRVPLRVENNNINIFPRQLTITPKTVIYRD